MFMRRSYNSSPLTNHLLDKKYFNQCKPQMMAPPPRPPIICYDLQTKGNARGASDPRYRVPLTGTVRKTKVTVVQKDASQLIDARANACWYQESYDRRESIKEHENVQIRKPTEQRSHKRTTKSHIPNDKVVRLNPRHYNNNLLHSKPYQFNTLSFGGNQSMLSKHNPNDARHAYGQKLRREMEEKERRLEARRERLATQTKLDEISQQMGTTKRLYENVCKTFGMSHNAAKFIQQQDEEYAKLKRKLDQCAETRSKELGRRVQQMKRVQECQRNQDKMVEEKRLKDMSITTHCKHKWNSTLNNSLSSSSQTTNTATTTNTASPSSTISISSCSSPMSADEHIPSIHFVEPPVYKSTTLPSSTILSSSTPSKKYHDVRRSSSNLSTRPKERFSFYKGNASEEKSILEVTDIDFFEKVEDKTMLEVNELVKKMQFDMRDFL